MLFLNDLWIFIGIFPLMLLITFLVRWCARRMGVVNMPNSIVPQHTQIIAYMGGVAIAVNVIFLSFVYFWSTGFEFIQFLFEHWFIVAALFLALGLYDDIRCLTPAVKLSAQIFLAILSVYFSGTEENTLISSIFDVFWILLLVNAYNFLDVMDGLLGGVAAVFFIFMMLIDVAHWQIYCIILMSIFAFMFFNSPPASIFMGDAGSHFLGYLVAIVTLNMFHEGSVEKIIAGVLLVAVPLFELMFITSVRIRKGLPWWKGSPDHMALRMQQSGLSKWGTNSIIWFLTSLMSLLAYLTCDLYAMIPLVIYWLVPFLFIALSYLLLQWDVKT